MEKWADVVYGWPLTNKTILAKHIGAIHEGNKAFKCDICDNSYSQKGSMERHVASVHEGKKPFKCYICDYSCSLKHQIKQHVSSGQARTNLNKSKKSLDFYFHSIKVHTQEAHNLY